jgi:polyhydroxybutyrate depolymerase
MHILSGGTQRTVAVFIPTGYDGRHSLPLVLDLHGSASTAAEEMSRTGMVKTAEARTFILAAPQGAIPSGPGFIWNVPHVTRKHPTARDDEQFLLDAVKSLKTTLCVNPRKVYAAGYSGGGRMISQFVCDMPGVFAAIAPVDGLRAGAPTQTIFGFKPDASTCHPSTPVPIISFAGTADRVNPFDGGGAASWGYGSMAAQRRWAEIDHCTQGPTTASVTEHVSVVTYAQCSSNARVEQYVVAGGGHTWPGGNASAFPAGMATTQEISASELMWKFFQAYNLPGQPS